MNFARFLPALPCLLLLSGCSKLPQADFTPDKAFYYVGETVQLTNTSKNSKNYVWIFPDGSTGSSKNASFEIPETLSNSLVFTLRASKRNGEKTEEIKRYVWLSQKLYSSDRFGISQDAPEKKEITVKETNYQVMVCTAVWENRCYRLVTTFKGSTRPAPGIYPVPGSVTVSYFLEYGGSPVNHYDATSGSITISSEGVPDGKYRMVLKDVQTTPLLSGSPDYKPYVSGNIIF